MYADVIGEKCLMLKGHLQNQNNATRLIIKTMICANTTRAIFTGYHIRLLCLTITELSAYLYFLIACLDNGFCYLDLFQLLLSLHKQDTLQNNYVVEYV